MIFCLNGRFINENKATVSVLDSGFLYADGFYDTMRAYDGVIFELPLHLKRLKKSANVMSITVPNAKKLTEWFQKIVRINKLQEARVRITVTRGTHKPTIAITCERLRNLVLRAESACTMRLERLQPAIKTLGGLAVLGPAALEKKKRGVDQVIMIDKSGFVREATTSNVFVVKNGRLLTPKSGILKGLTRHRVIALARKNGITVTVRDFKTGMLASADEIFLTNRIREIMPVVELNGEQIGKGMTGPVTKKLMKAYSELVKASLT